MMRARFEGTGSPHLSEGAGAGASVTTSASQHLEIAIGHLRKRRDRDGRAASVDLRHQALQHVGELVVLGEGQAGLTDELRVAAARPEDRGKTARERLEQRVRARIVVARRDVHVVAPEKVGHVLGTDRPDGTDALEPYLGASDEGHLEAPRVEAAVEPGDRVRTLTRVVGPARRDEPGRPAVERLPPLRRIEDRGIDRIRDDDRSDEVDPELAMFLQAVAGLEDGRSGDLVVEGSDALVGPVVEAAVDADRPVDPMNHSYVVAREASEPRDVEVERVEEARP